MRVPGRSGERWAAAELGGAGQVRAVGDDLRQRLDRLAACHPSSPDYGEPSPDYGELSPDYGEASPDYGETVPDYGGPDYEGPDYEGPDYDAVGAGAERAMDEPDRQASRPERRDGEPARRGEKPAGGLGPGRPAAWRTGGAGHRPDGGAAAGLTGRPAPYRPWFTAGESPEPWFTGETGG